MNQLACEQKKLRRLSNHPMKNHTKFLLGNRPYEALKKTFWIFHSKNLLEEAPKNLKKSLSNSI